MVAPWGQPYLGAHTLPVQLQLAEVQLRWSGQWIQPHTEGSALPLKTLAQLLQQLGPLGP